MLATVKPFRAGPTTRGCTSARPQGVRVIVRSNNAESSAAPVQEVNPNACKTCGVDLSKKPSGCDGEGRVVGGVGALPGMAWWPVKAYRPCPALSQAGMEYVRKGQPTNEMLFGGVSLGQTGSKSLELMQEQADKGIKVE